MWLSVFRLCLLAAVAWPGPARGEVVVAPAGFADCDAFFYQGAPPEGLLPAAAPVRICQKFKQEPRFATLYSTQDKIPLYAAFRYAGEEEAASADPDEEEKWLVEPQIDDPENGLEGMMPEAEVTGSVDNLGVNQALTADYVDSGYERGQLNPSSLHKDDHQVATHTLTNAVPMTPPLQEVWHWEVKNLVGRSLAPHCENGKDLYLLSGAVPSTLRVKDRVAVPEFLWLAACCDDGSEAWSVGFVKPVAPESRLEDVTVEALEKNLSAGAQLFKNNCGQDRHDPKKLETVLRSAKQTRVEKPIIQGKKSTKSHQKDTTKKEGDGFLKKLFNYFMVPLFQWLKSFFYLICQGVKFIFCLLFRIVRCIIRSVCTFIKAIFTALLNVFIDVFRVAVNILNGIANNIYNVLMAMYRVISIPVCLILDIVSFPFYVLGAIPSVLKDIATGVGGLFLHIINATTSIVKGLNYVVSQIAKRFLPKIVSGA
ncbi:endonuclease domain-containing 1 protein [Elgaria multicarinata webbii]|uniref:endonuclease domain-containing 1 protein n=1 Tax=Elgaria multicarinata webbii TaxID=159646 RepID=UPI002FCD1CF5